MIDVVLLLGGNMGDMSHNIIRVKELISSHIGDIQRESSVYRTAAWGFESTEFLNQVTVCRTLLTAEDVLFAIWEIERLFGRDRGTKEQEIERFVRRQEGKTGYSDRSMDIDILYYGDQCIHTDLLQIPHPLIMQRDFVMTPLKELGLLESV